jgi:hypothetical protein
MRHTTGTPGLSVPSSRYANVTSLPLIDRVGAFSS